MDVFLSQYMGKMEPWCKACGEGELPSELQDLEDTIHHHQGLYEHITTAYSEVSTLIHTHTLCRLRATVQLHITNNENKSREERQINSFSFPQGSFLPLPDFDR